MRVLVWHWGRRGAGPRYAVELAAALRAQPDTEAVLSLSAQAEILGTGDAGPLVLPYRTYDGVLSLLARLPLAFAEVTPLADRLRGLALDGAVCAMPAYLDPLMTAALRRAGPAKSGIPWAVVVHDADPHPGDQSPLKMVMQRRMMSRAAAVVCLTGHVADRLRAQRLAGVPGRPPIIRSTPPPLAFCDHPPPPGPRAGRPLRLLSFGRLLPYKGLDMLSEALAKLGPRDDLLCRVVGTGPETPVVAALRARAGVTVENRWVPETEVAHLLAWADAVVLSHREASQSGVAAAGLAAGRWVIATDVGGLREQIGHERLARLCPPTADGLAGAITALLADASDPPPAPDPHAAWSEAAGDLVEKLGAAFRR